jgi:hypothetical protein
MGVGPVCIEEDGVGVFRLCFKEVVVFPVAMGNHGVSLFAVQRKLSVIGSG